MKKSKKTSQFPKQLLYLYPQIECKLIIYSTKLLTNSFIMKKLSLLIAMIAFVCGNAFAQLSYDFNDGTAGAKIAQTYGAPGTTWSNAPGGAEDGVFAEMGGSMAAHFTYNNDQVLDLGNLTSGAYYVSFDMYIPNGKDAYNNILHVFNGQGSQWATEVHYKTSEHGTMIEVGGEETNFDCPYDAWFNVKYFIDLDNDVATFYVEETEIVTWQFSLKADGGAGTRQLAAMDFYPPTSAAVSEYYIDNVEFVSANEDEVVIDDDFEAYTVGNKIASEAIAAGNDFWTTWSNAPGGAEDGVVATQGTKTGHLTYNNDQVLLLGDVTSGTYTCSFDMYIPNGKDAYNNILHIFNGSGSQWATEVHFKRSTEGTMIEAGGVETNFECPYDAWFNVKYVIDLDGDEATFFIDDEEIVSWQFSLKADGGAGTRQLAAMDFFPPTSAAVSEYYIDNILVVKAGGVSAPAISVSVDELSATVGEDDETSVDFTIDNTGNSIGEWNAYIDFGHGGAGTQTMELKYHDGEAYSGIGSSGGPYAREMAIRLPATAYAGSAMGMKIKSVEFLTSSQYASADNTYVFRIYGQGANNQPGEMLAEKSVTSSALETWLTATFDEEVYLNGQVIWATVGLMQNAGEYPLTMDGGEYGEEADGNWLSTQGGSFDHCYSAGSFGGAWLITVNCEGEIIPGNWARLNQYEGSIAGGQSQVVTLTFNTIGIEGGDYSGELVINTNDEANPTFNIPVTLHADFDAVEEVENDKVSIYPNPAVNQVTLTGENLNTLAIYNVAGQLVRIVKLNEVVNTIDMNVEAGVYFFSIYDNNGVNTVRRVVIAQ